MTKFLCLVIVAHMVKNMEIKEFDVVRLIDGREATIMEVFETVCIVDVGDSPETWETIDVARTDIVEITWSASCREITEYDGYKLNPKRLKENASEEEKKAYETEKAIAKEKSEKILSKLRSKI